MSADCCFYKNNRLRKPKEFSHVYQQNQLSVKGRYFVVLAFCRTCEAEKQAPSRIGVVVSKKVSKRAVDRNRIKRLMREQFRQRQHPLGKDFVFIAKPMAGAQDNSALNNELAYLWRKLHKKCNEY